MLAAARAMPLLAVPRQPAIAHVAEKLEHDPANARPAGDRVLPLRAAHDRGAVPVQQVRQGLPADEPRRQQQPAVHEQRGQRDDAVARQRRPADLLRGHRAGRHVPLRRLQRRRLSSGHVRPRPAPRRARPGRVHRRRPAPHGDGRRRATLHLPIKPGTDLALLNGLLHLLHAGADSITPSSPTTPTAGHELEAMLAEYPADARCARSAASACYDLVARRPRSSSDAERLITFWTMGVNQTHARARSPATRSSTCTWPPARSASPAAARSASPASPTRWAGATSGYMSHLLPGQRLIANPEHRRQMEQLWGLAPGTIHPHAGYDAVRMFDALARRRDQGDLDHRHQPRRVHAEPADGPRRRWKRPSWSSCRTRTTRPRRRSFAHVLLPAAVNLEQTGTFCNSERRVTLMEQVVPPPGDARPDWWWVPAGGRRRWVSQAACASTTSADDLRRVRPHHRRPPERPERTARTSCSASKGPQQWPYPAIGRIPQHAATRTALSHAQRPGALLRPPHIADAGEAPDARVPADAHHRPVSPVAHAHEDRPRGRSSTSSTPPPYVQIHPDDAAAARPHDGQHGHRHQPPRRC